MINAVGTQISSNMTHMLHVLVCGYTCRWSVVRMALEKARVAKSLGDINPLEFPLQLASAIAWMTYGEADHL
jgi:hypothetical protein